MAHERKSGRDFTAYRSFRDKIWLYRTAMWGGTGMDGRRHWFDAGYSGDLSLARRTSLAQFTPNSTPYDANITAHFGKNSEDGRDTLIAIGNR
jgi:hypothetical protein